ncbi:MAG: hypothetical protein Q4E53_07600 [Eubacteriales bacterium]|nr:hypothetical protein [Eubacteriales bacterium]
MEDALAAYEIQGNKFDYLKVGEVKTLNGVKHNGIGGYIEIVSEGAVNYLSENIKDKIVGFGNSFTLKKWNYI